ncbi:ATP-binding response regulator [Marinigracilibium pacificum]|uniref:histidine kinase n=1 Tax=Marinigracilibium pacificum TaxID=2729599 RepID=A0A848IYY8_9BACT|nr:response regulator [Marinigracilibium pacificum]NMM47434.1 response regulator [Marinigracilibium pacificum]
MLHQILLVDDMRAIYTAISKTLSERGCEIDYCATGKEGIEVANKKQYDLIILDVHLPDISGIDICACLKRSEKYKLRPILLLTSDARKLEIGLKAGASDYILKPFNEVELIARIFTQLNISKEHLKSVTANKELTKSLSKEKIRFKDAQTELHRYFYQTAHRLRSPLTTMEGLLKLLEMEYPDVASNEYVILIKENLRKLYYVNQQVAHIGELKSHELSKVTFKLAVCMDNFICEYYKRSDFEINIEENLVLNTDPFIFKQALKPLIDNAVFYSKSVNYSGRVLIGAEFEQGNCFLIIYDNGPGISKTHLNRIFDLFFVGSPDSLGNGLGLFISKLALERIGAAITLESEEKKYTKVKINITSLVSSQFVNLNVSKSINQKEWR